MDALGIPLLFFLSPCRFFFLIAHLIIILDKQDGIIPPLVLSHHANETAV